MSSPCLLVTLFAKRTLGVCADLAAEAIPAFTDAGEFGAGEFTPGKQAGKHQIKECRLVVQGTRGNAEHLHPFRVGKIAGNAAHEARRVMSSGSTDRPPVVTSRSAPASWISRTASAMRFTSSGAMTERTTSQWN